VPSYSPSTRSHPGASDETAARRLVPAEPPLVNSTTAFFKKSLSWDDFDFIQKTPTYRAPAGVAGDGATGARKTLERFWLNASEYALRKGTKALAWPAQPMSSARSSSI
jgi:hypothetical protein